MVKDFGITRDEWKPSIVKITYGHEETSGSLGSIVLSLKVEKHDLELHVYQILEITPFPVIIGLDLMKKENVLMGYHEGKKFLEINGSRTYFSSTTIEYPLEMNEEILEISEEFTRTSFISMIKHFY